MLSCVNIFTLIFLLAVGVRAYPANSTLVNNFVDCLHMHNASDYSYNVTSDGALFLTVLEDNGANTDRTAYSKCNHLFGMGFHCLFVKNVATYLPELTFASISDMTAGGLLASGLAAREGLQPPGNQASIMRG